MLMKSFTIGTEINKEYRSLCLHSSMKPVIGLSATKTSCRECYCPVKEHHVTLKWHIHQKTTKEEYSHNAGTTLLVSCILKLWKSQEAPGGWDGREPCVSPDSAQSSGCTAGSVQCPLQQLYSMVLQNVAPEELEEVSVPYVGPILTLLNPPQPFLQGLHCSTRFPPSDFPNDQKPLGARSR